MTVRHRLPTKDELKTLPRIELNSQDKWKPMDPFDQLPLSDRDTNGSNDDENNRGATFMVSDTTVINTSELPNDCGSDSVHNRLPHKRRVRSPPDRSPSFDRSNGQQNRSATLSLLEVTRSTDKDNATLWMRGEKPDPVLEEVTPYKHHIRKHPKKGPG